MQSNVYLALMAGVLAGLSGCATGAGDSTASIVTPAAAATASAGEAGYVLSSDELGYDCKQLTGRMQVRILEVRDYNERNQSTAASRILQSAVTSVLGGTTTGKDPGGAIAKDRAMLQAYNRQLVAKGCKSFDLDSELQPKDLKSTPVPSVAAPSKASIPAR